MTRSGRSPAMIICALLALLLPANSHALDFSLRGRIQSELDANPFLREQGIRLQVVNEENGYVTIEMVEGDKNIRGWIRKGTDVVSPGFEPLWLMRDPKESEQKAFYALKRSIEYIGKMEGVKRIQLTATGNNRPEQVESLMRQGQEAWNKKDGQRAAQYYEQAYALGSLKAAAVLGQMYLKGLGVPKNEIRGVALIRQAAEQGDQAVQRQAQYDLSKMYLDGTGVPEDSREAAAWLRKAAEKGHPEAQFELGLLFETGGMGKVAWEKDQDQAYSWFNKAADSFREYAQGGLPRAQCILGVIYAEGKIGRRDYGQAIEWFEKCVENEKPSSIFYELARVGLVKIYASCKDARFLNGPLAVLHAQALVKGGSANSEHLELLAAAYARNGQFSNAVSTQRKAFERLSGEKMTEERRRQELSRIQHRLSLYASEQPYVNDEVDR